MLHRIKKSPFLLATIAGLIVTFVDMLWLAGELSTHFGILSQEAYVIYRFFIFGGLFFGLLIMFAGIYIYIKDKYLTLDDIQHAKVCIERRSQVKRNKVFK